jgi:dolichol-phosphate mannosyltransferase
MKLISIIIPAYNEEKNIKPIYDALQGIIKSCSRDYIFEILFVNDGSLDNTIGEIEKLCKIDQSIEYLDFSRNFGKEIATTAGINMCKGDACIMIDSDLQHPVELIPDFIAQWEKGFDVVVGIRNSNKSDSFLKKIGSKFFYKIINKIAEIEIVPNSTDFRLLDRIVIEEFKKFKEAERMTRALIDWLGFRRTYIYFDANPRLNGTASYSFWKLLKLALNSFISLSLFPLKIAGYLGVTITLFSGMAGLYILIGKYFLRASFASTFSDSENLAILLVFLVGIILMSVGLLALYVANIHGEVIRRPLFIIRRSRV